MVDGESAELICDPGFALETDEKFLKCSGGIVVDDILVNCVEVVSDGGAFERIKRSTSQTTSGLERTLKGKTKKRHFQKKVKINFKMSRDCTLNL